MDIKTIDLKATPTDWYTVLPTQVQPCFSSVEAAVFSIVNRDLTGTATASSVPKNAAAPAGVGVEYAAMIAAGGMAAIALL